MSVLLIGITIAAAVFSALLWSLFRAFTATTFLRINAAALSAATLSFFAAMSLGHMRLALIAAAILVVTGLIAIIGDERWSKLLPLVQVALGACMIYLMVTPII